MYKVYSRPYAAQAYYLLGDYETTLRVLQGFEPSNLYTAGFDTGGECWDGSGCFAARHTSGWAGWRKHASSTAES